MADCSETLFVGGRFIDPSKGSHPVGDALLERDGKIVFVGRRSDAESLISREARWIELHGRTVVPGWVDAHVHLWWMGKFKSVCDLAGTKTRQEAIERIASFAAEHPETLWVQGRGYNLNAWDDPSYPTARELDRDIPHRPCLLKSFDGHSAWMNTPALSAANLTRDTPDPKGGRILRDADGNPSGCVLEGAVSLASNVLPPDTDAETERAFRLAVDEMVNLGFTGVHVPMSFSEHSPSETRMWLQKLYPDNSCPLRMRFFGPFKMMEEVLHFAGDTPQANRVQMCGIKIFCDGSLGSRTAWMFEPFCGEGDNRGLSVIDGKELRDQIGTANRAGLPVICHAIGDRACNETLAAFLEAGDPSIGNRIEHAQFLRREDIELFARLGVGASMQPAHLWTDWEASDRLIGAERCRWSLGLRSLLDAGAVVAVGSDAPVVPPDPRHSLHAAATRTDAERRPRGGWYPEQRISPTEWAACSSAGAWGSIGEGERRGGLEAGMDCDLTIVREGFLEEGFKDFLELHVDGTVIGGQATFLEMDGESGD